MSEIATGILIGAFVIVPGFLAFYMLWKFDNRD